MLAAMADPRSPSVLSSWARTIVDALAARGVDTDAVLLEARLSPADFHDPNARHPIVATTRLWRLAARHAEDPAFGLHASRFVRQTTFHALGYAVMASSTLREALHRWTRYGRLVSDVAELHVDSIGGVVRLSILLPEGDGAPAYEAMDAVVSLIVRTCRLLSDGQVSPTAIALRRPTPVDVVPYRQLFRCPVDFEAPVDTLDFEEAWLDHPLPAANPDLARHNDDAVRRYLAESSAGSLADRVRSLVLDRLVNGEPSPDAIARALGLSLRSLQRRLRQTDTSYAKILAEARRDLACEHLREQRFSVTEIAFLLGFEDTSAFSRAFRRWTGVTPTAFRRSATS